MVGLISISHPSFDKLLWVPTSRIWGYPMLKQLTGWKKSQTRQPRALSDCTKLEGCSQEQVLWSLRWQGQKSEIRKRKRIFFFLYPQLVDMLVWPCQFRSQHGSTPAHLHGRKIHRPAECPRAVCGGTNKNTSLKFPVQSDEPICEAGIEMQA